MSQAERKKFIATFIKLIQQEEFLEKSIETFVMGMKVETDVIEDLIQTRKQCSIERKKVTDPIYRIGTDISNDLQTVKLMISQVHEGEKIDPEELKSRLLSLSKKIKDFNPASHLEALGTEQKKLEEALLDFRINIHEYEKPNSGLGAACFKKNSQNKKIFEIDNYDGIKDFDSLVFKTGHTQYWKQEDHLFFLKVRNKSTTIPAMVLEMRKKCPDLTAEEIINHEVWYKIYTDLREKQKNSVKEWRKKKELQRFERTKSLQNNNDNVHNELNEKISHNKSNDLVILNENKSTKTTESSQTGIQGRDEKKELIKKWKVEKENARLADVERLKNHTEGIRSWKEQQFLLRSIEIKAALDNYRTNKIPEKMCKKQTKDDNKIVKAPKLVKSFRQRDNNYMRQRKIILNSKHDNDSNLEVNTTPVRSKSASTLLKPTKIWEQRCRQKWTADASPKALVYIKNLPRLSTYNLKNQESIISL